MLIGVLLWLLYKIQCLYVFTGILFVVFFTYSTGVYVLSCLFLYVCVFYTLWGPFSGK